ncbi:DUF1080 domain-containing protein [Maribellus comscasis]|uniref:DUF1080 domain-containing protein n=1 Tax=Maribellus comscasis TaxID=2681766 RepID=A0A6I6K304_9BACT|nr:DUF1080 domain-containing protein [Maribellus comscasis]QGY46907.1 DUF1080 domain-containing protein [Maribellus comscasis]
MKSSKIFVTAILCITVLTGWAQNSKNGFFGMWTIAIENGSVGWLSVNDDKGYLDAELLWQGGSVVPVANVYFEDENTLVVTRSQERPVNRDDEDGRKFVVTQTYRFTRNGDKATGVAVFPSRDRMSINKTKFEAWKLPPVSATPDLSKVKYGKSVKLFNGKNLDGWRLINPKQANGFKVIDGALVNDPVQKEGEHISYGNLRTEDEFEDFNLKLEVNIPEHNNSGVYLRGMYEIQVFDSYGKPLDSHNMGALYSRVTPSVNAEKPAGQWQTLDITLCDRHVTVVLNGTTIIDNQPAYGPTGGAIIADVFKPGPIYLQGDHGKVSYRNIVLTPIVK